MAKLFGSLHTVAIVEPSRLFANVNAEGSNQKPYILLRNPRGFGRQIILDVAVTGVDEQSRTSDDNADHPLDLRYDQKVCNY